MTEETNIINETKLINQILEPRLRPQLLFIRVMLSLLYISILYSYYKEHIIIILFNITCSRYHIARNCSFGNKQQSLTIFTMYCFVSFRSIWSHVLFSFVFALLFWYPCLRDMQNSYYLLHKL